MLAGGVAAAARVAARWLLRSNRYGSDEIDAPVGTAATVIDAAVVSYCKTLTVSRTGGGCKPPSGFRELQLQLWADSWRPTVGNHACVSDGGCE